MTNAQILQNLVKVAFIPNPSMAGGQQSPGASQSQDPSQMQQQPDPSQMGGGQPQMPGAGDISQGADPQQEAMAQMMQAQQQQGGGQGSQVPPGMADPSGHVHAEGNLDNTHVDLTVKELLDLVSGGKTSVGLNKVKLEAHKHNKAMEALERKSQQEQAAAEAQQQQQQQVAQAGMMGGGGVYPSGPMNQTPQQPGM